ncbi:GNAT family N-acetyltransferase [Glycomyces sp. TRM65418]|uniref:GNAT family N-acetyltransferase n=1 Tax=Glycomyces sp. TRM65418 TaxID=2867006 RepID=UPI001CE6E70E|nr:GNAT family N-acetyltransferase [Glycomyces sp. TRM65418]MCC3762421.1 GNAT family N-acetyltransferase [Glycomyces sp. TRM65418]QZD56466.1 GNAT family N-acetyltransferase [Glycomyces sp. TRM65418]
MKDAAPGRRFTDITGELIEIGPERWRVLPASGTAVTVDAADVVAARPIPPKPTAFSEILELERHLAATWPAIETADLGGWVLRYSQGFSRRANSALALTAPEGGPDAAVAAVEAWYDARGARPLVALAGPVTKRLEADLASRGWEAEGAAAVMTKALEPVAYTGEARVVPEPCAAFLEQAGRGRPEVAARVFGAGPGRGYAEVWRDGSLAARGRGAIAGDTVAITNIGTLPQWRRQGLGAEVLHALEAWGAEHGARRAALQVETDNEAALAMYARQGYAERYRYAYRARPV